MNRVPRIVIVYSTFGEGHVQVAKALKQSFEAKGYRRIHLVDFFADSHPVWNAISRFAYLKSSVFCPNLYGMAYDWLNSSKPESFVYKWLHGMGKRKVLDIVKWLKPDAVVHTFPFLAVSQLNRDAELAVPTFTVLTDYVLHSHWIHSCTDRYFVATVELKSEMKASGVNENRITVSGIPIREAFAKSVSKEAVLSKFGLDAGKNYLLLVAGAYGVLTQVQRLLQAVLLNTGYEVLLVCGKNKKLTERMVAQYGNESRVNVFGFVDGIEELMAVSSCMVTKAGGITLTEASAMALPVVVYRPLPGQEAGNAESLAGNGALLIARTIEELVAHLDRLEHEDFRTRMGSAIHGIYGPDAASLIVSEVLQYVEQFQYIRQWVPEMEERQAIHEYR